MTNSNSETVITSMNGKDYCVIKQRENMKSYPNHPFAVEYKLHTPKGKYTSSKTYYNYVYRTMGEALLAAQNYIAGKDSRYLDAKKRRDEKKVQNANVKASDFYKVGDIIVNTWGYDQTNVDFYQVTKLTDKTIEVVEINQTTVDGSQGFMSCDVLPSTTFAKDGKTYKLRVYANGKLSNPTSYYYMHKWDGRPEYCSWYH